MAYRRTLKRSVSCTGIGLHTGKAVQLVLRPAPPETGIRFIRTDVGVEIPASLEHIERTDYATTLRVDGVGVNTVEHLLSALWSLGVDDAIVEVDGPEVPILDGSAAPFVILIHEAGLRPVATPRRYLKVVAPVEVNQGGRLVRFLPADHLRVSYTIGFDHPLLRHQALAMRISADTFVDSIAPARTFGFLRDVEMLRRSGLALGGSLENAIVISESGVLNNKLRFEDEFVRHKILDILGDFALLGFPLIASVEAVRAGHAMHAAAAKKLLRTQEAWTLVAHPQLLNIEIPSAPQMTFEPSAT
ncbi:MAG: UDP-3-O-acyl-N-acetylglucosamine deacetylase [Vicinamibacteria bacterium]|jgi:UDP-3-O-[3-hydroxymyristoyl] N-acetylglucosamine deacetylase|nr:UDP-3-O-acyl-N-acetylglucosamine deacetylase [Vicinamibacteria bacterium]